VGPITNHRETSRQTNHDSMETHEATHSRQISPPDYQQIMYNQFEHCQQGTRTVTTYTEQFYRLSSHCDLSMMEEQQAAKYISGLKYSIQERVILHDVFSVDEAHNKALKVERLQCRIPLSMPLTPNEETTTETPAEP